MIAPHPRGQIAAVLGATVVADLRAEEARALHVYDLLNTMNDRAAPTPTARGKQ